MATSNDLREPRAHNSPELAVDPTDDRFAALAYRLDNPDFSCGLQLSGDGGDSWVDGEPLVALPPGVDHCYAPQVVFDADGTLYYLFVGLSGQGNTPQGVWLTNSEDRGRSFARPWQVLGEFNYQVRLAIDRQMDGQGRLHLVWLAVREGPTLGALPPTHNPVVAAHSDDGGRTFSEPVEVSGPERRLVVAPDIAIGGAGEVHIVYYDLKDDVRDYQGLEGPVWPEPWAVEVASSSDGGESFVAPVVVDGGVQPAERVMVIFTMPPPSIAADGDGHVYAAWHEARQDDWDVVAASSADQGGSWTEPVVVGDDHAASTRQLLPQLAVAPDGRVEVVFFDRQGGAADHLQHVGYAVSHDHGHSFSAVQRLTTEASDSRSGPRAHLPVAQGRIEFGTGLALHAGHTAALAAWPDTRFAVPGTAQQDLYTNLVARDAAGSTARWWLTGVLATLGAVAAVGLVILGWRRRGSMSAMSAGAMLLAIVAASCQQRGSVTADSPLPGKPATVQVELEEYAFNVSEPVPPGRVVFELINRGDEAHELVLLRVPEETGGLEDLLASLSPRALPPTFVVPPRDPGQSAAFAVDLEPGRYGLICFVEDAGGVQHHRLGMVAEFGVDP